VLKSQTPREACFNIVICDHPAARGERLASRRINRFYPAE
jgi:hypothetical protein